MKLFKKDMLSNNKGITLIMMALMLALLLALAALAIDIGYMYVVKNELQVAADAASLAGAALATGEIDNTAINPNALLQTSARQAAWRFACRNRAAGSNVYLVTNNPADCNTTSPPSNLNNANSATGDIIVGHWRSTAPGTVYCATGWETLGNGYFCRANGSTGFAINAVKTVPRRTAAGSGYGMGPVRLFLGGVLRALPQGAADWRFMSARAEAIASRPPRAQIPIVICLDTCTPGIVSPDGTLLYWAPYPREVTPGNVGIAWTSFNPSSQQMENDEINAITCGKEINACGLTIYTSNGNINSLQRQLRCAFKNPLYESLNKTCSDGNCDSILDTVTSWTVLIAIVQSPNGCPTGDQPAPDTVVSYGRMTITEVYASGGGGTNECACRAYDAPVLTGSEPNAIRVTSIQCLACPATEFIGSTPVLVK